MILGFHYHIPAFEKEGVIYTSGFLGVFLDSLALNVTELVCFMHTPLPDEEFLMDYGLKSRNIRWVSIGPHTSVPKRLLSASRIIKRIKSELTGIDILLIRSPTPLLPALSSIKNVKKAFLLVGDYQKSAQDLRQPFFRKKAIQLWASLNKWQQERAIKHALVFVNNGLIYNELKERVKNLHLVRTTTLQRTDFYYREDTCQKENINLLYTGRLDLSKGLLEMIESLAIIRAKGVEACLHLVGWEDKNATEVTTILQNKAHLLGISKSVFFHGKKQVGDELNAFYRMADIFIIGSKVNEGFPRTIWEAFANSVPVIASKVGSIPLFLTDKQHAYMIKPGDVEEMAEAILELINNSDLRRSLIKNSIKMAQESSLEVQTKSMISLIKVNSF